MLQLSIGTMPHDQVMHAIELLATKVAPVVPQRLGVGVLEVGESDKKKELFWKTTPF